MKYTNTQNILSHPQACLIPRGCLLSTESLFDEELTDFQIELIKKPLEDLLSNRMVCVDEKEAYTTWICIAAGHPNATEVQLKTLASQCNIRLVSLVQLCAVMGRLSLFESVLAEYSNTKSQAQISTILKICYKKAAENGQLTVMQAIENKVDAQLFINDSLYTEVAIAGYVPVLRHLLSKPSQLQAQNIKTIFTAGASNLEVFNFIKIIAPITMREVLKSDHGEFIFNNIFRNGSLEVIRQCAELAPELFDMLREAFLQSSEDFIRYRDNAYALAVEGGNMDGIKYLEQKMPKAVISHMIEDCNFSVLNWALAYDRFEIANHLLTHADCLGYAEMHDEKFATFTYPFVENKLASLRNASLNHKIKKLNGVFDLQEASEVQSCFFMIRNLIRRNAVFYNRGLEFLLNIPAVRSHINTTLIGSLMSLAKEKNNATAVRLLQNRVDELLSASSSSTLQEQNCSI